MQDFNNIKYERISYEKTKQEINKLIESINKAKDCNTFIDVCKKIISIQNHIEEMYDYADIRNMRDSNDAFFSNEIEYWNEFKPKFDLLFSPFYANIIHSKYRAKLVEIMPSNFFSSIEYQLKISSEDIIELQKQENILKKKYKDLEKNKIIFDGEERSISYISSFFTNKDRSIRKKAHDALNDYYYAKQKEYDKLFFDLINIRNSIAKKLGFDNYSTYSLYRLRRFGYNYKDIDRFRKNIVQYIIPLCKKITECQKEELALEKLEYYDTVFFKEMPHVEYSGVELLNKIGESFKKIDMDLYSLFRNMLKKHYIDLVQKDNKVNFAITNYLVETELPVITGNYKNNYLDVQTTTHEMGHSFQKYCASMKDKEYVISSLLKYPTMEVAEMFSYAMELISMNYLENLFRKEDYNKYCFMKIYNLVANLPYICLVDEFQEKIYSKNDLKIEDIRNEWLKLVKKYHIEKSNSGHINLETGGYFYRQSHIFLDPFYYIDYALSYFGAFAIFDKCKNDLKLFKEIGAVASYYPFHKLIDEYGMPNPFEEQTVKNISIKLEIELSNKRCI